VGCVATDGAAAGATEAALELDVSPPIRATVLSAGSAAASEA
jgi:hypothetical protein